MKKLTIGIAACALAAACALVGCSNGSQQAAPANNQTSAAPAATSAPAQPAETSAPAQQPAGTVQEGTVEWTAVGSAEDAAKGAGFDHFAIMDKIQLGDLTFENPTFSYAGGVAEALYEKGAAALIVRKADGRHTAPMTDRDKVDFDVKWIENLNGVDTTLYGDTQGAATVVDWNIDTEDYTVTYQGLGGEEMTMTSDEAGAIVKGFMDADAALEAAQNNNQSADQGGGNQGGGNQGGGSGGGSVPISGDGSGFPISAEQAASIATAVMGGTATSVTFTYSDLYGDCWYVALSGPDTVPIGAYVNAYGAAYAANKDHNPDTPAHQSVTQDQAALLAAQAFGGYADSISLSKDSDGNEIWVVAVHNDKGDKATYYVNMLGNAYPAS